jgi:hypothetical protein
MEMDYIQYKIETFDLVPDPGFGTATLTNFFTKNYIRMKRIRNLFNF